MPRPRREQKRVDTGLTPKQKEAWQSRDAGKNGEEVTVSISPTRRTINYSAQKKGFSVKPAEVNHFTGKVLPGAS